MKSAKRILTFILAITMLFTSISVLSVSADYTDAKVLTSGVSSSGQLFVKGEEGAVWYKFTASSEALEVKLSHTLCTESDVFFIIEVFLSNDAPEGKNPTAKFEVKGNSESRTIKFNTPSVDEYYIKISTNNDSALKTVYSILCTSVINPTPKESEPNNSYRAANNMPSSSFICEASLSGADDIDYFRFKSERGYAVLRFISRSTASNTKYKASILTVPSGADNPVTIAEFDISLIGNNCPSLPLGLEEGTYYLCISSTEFDNTAQNNYAVEISFHNSKSFETESNDTYESATKMIVTANGLMVQGCTMIKHDVDWFRFSVDKGQKISTTFFCSSLESSNCVWTVYVYKADDFENSKLYTVFTSITESQDKLEPLDEGEYYIRVEGSTTGTYQIILKREKYADITNLGGFLSQLFQRVSVLDWTNFKNSFGWLTKINWVTAFVSLGEGLISVFKFLGSVIGLR